ncbi:hypothetical protein [Clostridium baratii]|uniref:YobI family P-loop NTPase n=1 Tax=Clostridium baratii TaxID=1561 RepID=UPI000982596F|nr:hypothetical protein [Clostridium baratii]AQM60346.2 hypothetical protein NPD11_1 [Clostridium baratii]
MINKKKKPKLKKFLMYILEKVLLINRWIYKTISKLNEKNYKLNNYVELTPIDTLKKDSTYIESLKWAIDNDKTNNIAISGKYGAGKSSIIESFKKHYPEYEYINVSLANFIDNCDGNIEDKLEKRILEQLFYKVKYKKIPFSRYRKIRNVGIGEAIRIGLVILLAVVTSSIIINPDIISNTYDKFDKISKNLNDIFPSFLQISWINYIVLGVAILSVSFLSIQVIKLIKSKFVINKVTGKNISVEATMEPIDTIFNKYIDEIVYFFEATNYEVIFFEDIDRFNNVNIFTKLRELNILINNSEAIKQRVKFIYAVKDEIFGEIVQKEVKKNDNKEKGNEKDNDNNQGDYLKYYSNVSKNRTKFFDYILPVIPIVNNENSYDKLLEINNKLEDELKIDEKLLSDVSIYCDDMRVLRNIVNEYITMYNTIKENYIYEKNNTKYEIEDSINEFKCDKNQLFAMIVYKNLYPVDFSKLLNDSGILYNIFKNKKEYIEVQKESLKKEIIAKTNSLEILKKEIFYDINELYLCYKAKWKEKYDYVYINGSNNYFDENFKKRDYLDYINSLDKISIYKNSWMISNESKVEKDIWCIGGSRNYYERFIEIEKSKGDIEKRIKELTKEIDNLHNKIDLLESQKICNLINKNISESVLLEKNKDLNNIPYLIRMLKKGIINEGYKNSISYFYEGKLSADDYLFLQSVLNRKINKFDYPLINSKEIIKKLYVEDFKEEFVLNYNLVEFLLKSDEYRVYKDALIENMINLEDKYVNFVEGFSRERDIENTALLLYECSIRDNEFISKYIEFNVNEKRRFEIIIEYINQNKVRVIKENLNFDIIVKKIIFETKFFIETDLKIEYEKFAELLNGLIINIDKIKKVDISLLNNDQIEMYKKYINIVYESLRYGFNEEVLDEIILWRINNSNLGNKGYYTLAKEYNLNDMVEYLSDFADDYVENVLLKTEKKESNENIIELINLMDTNRESIKKLIENIEFKVFDINEIDKDIWGIAIKNRRIYNKWSEIIKYYLYKNELNEIIIDYINDELVCIELSEYKFDDEYDNVEKEAEDKIYDFEWGILSNNKINEESLNILMKSFGNPFTDLDMGDVTVERLLYLINNSRIATNKNSFKTINQKDKNLAVILLKKDINSYIENYSEYEIDSEQFIDIISDKNIGNNARKEVVKIAINNIEDEKELAKAIAEYELENSKLNELELNVLKYIAISEIDNKLKFDIIERNIDVYLEYENEFKKEIEVLDKLINSKNISQSSKDKLISIIIKNELNDINLINSVYKNKEKNFEEEMNDDIIDYFMDSQINENNKLNLLKTQIKFKENQKIEKWLDLISPNLGKLVWSEEDNILVENEKSIRELIKELKEKDIIKDYKEIAKNKLNIETNNIFSSELND